MCLFVHIFIVAEKSDISLYKKSFSECVGLEDRRVNFRIFFTFFFEAYFFLQLVYLLNKFLSETLSEDSALSSNPDSSLLFLFSILNCHFFFILFFFYYIQIGYTRNILHLYKFQSFLSPRQACPKLVLQFSALISLLFTAPIKDLHLPINFCIYMQLLFILS